jgi:hypothetical protein
MTLLIQITFAILWEALTWHSRWDDAINQEIVFEPQFCEQGDEAQGLGDRRLQ